MSEVTMPMADPGDQLRKARERAGINLKQVAETTLVSVARLESLEKQDLERVGGVAYVTGYARAYARAIGVDSEPYVLGFEALLGVEKQKTEPADFSIVRPTKSLFSVSAVMVIAVLAVMVGSLYWYFSLPAEPDLRQSSNLPAVREASPIEPIKSPEPEPEQKSESTPQMLPQELKPESEFEEISDIGNADIIDDALAENSAQLRPDAEPDLAGGGDRVGAQQLTAATPGVKDSLIIGFRGECWVEVNDAAGEVNIAQIAQSGDNLQLFGSAPFEIMLGNARVVDVVYNGEMVSVPVRGGRNTAKFTIGTGSTTTQ